MSEAQAQLGALQAALAGFAAQRMDALSLAKTCRAQSALTAQLPAVFATVLNDIANRLESGALFSEESCSFSQADLVAELQMWVTKANEKLANAKQGV